MKLHFPKYIKVIIKNDNDDYLYFENHELVTRKYDRNFNKENCKWILNTNTYSNIFSIKSTTAIENEIETDNFGFSMGNGKLISEVS